MNYEIFEVYRKYEFRGVKGCLSLIKGKDIVERIKEIYPRSIIYDTSKNGFDKETVVIASGRDDNLLINFDLKDKDIYSKIAIVGNVKDIKENLEKNAGFKLKKWE